MHACPGPACEAQVSSVMLACRRHWYQVSPATRSLVYRAWANGDGAGSSEHSEAIKKAISEMKP